MRGDTVTVQKSLVKSGVRYNKESGVQYDVASMLRFHRKDSSPAFTSSSYGVCSMLHSLYTRLPRCLSCISKANYWKHLLLLRTEQDRLGVLVTYHFLVRTWRYITPEATTE